MYHISHDPRSKQSAKRICDALLNCSKHKPFDEISVSDLHNHYQISRTTFYRLFDNTVDVLEYMVECMAQEILLNLRGDTVKELIIHAIIELEKRQDLIELLSQNGRIDIFQKKGEKYIPLSRLMVGLDLSQGYEYFNAILSHLIPLSMDVWVSHGKKDSPEEIYEKLQQSIQLISKWFSD